MEYYCGLCGEYWLDCLGECEYLDIVGPGGGLGGDIAAELGVELKEVM